MGWPSKLLSLGQNEFHLYSINIFGSFECLPAVWASSTSIWWIHFASSVCAWLCVRACICVGFWRGVSVSHIWNVYCMKRSFRILMILLLLWKMEYCTGTSSLIRCIVRIFLSGARWTLHNSLLFKTRLSHTHTYSGIRKINKSKIESYCTFNNIYCC